MLENRSVDLETAAFVMLIRRDGRPPSSGSTGSCTVGFFWGMSSSVEFMISTTVVEPLSLSLIDTTQIKIDTKRLKTSYNSSIAGFQTVFGVDIII